MRAREHEAGQSVDLYEETARVRTRGAYDAAFQANGTQRTSKVPAEWRATPDEEREIERVMAKVREWGDAS